jgi:hypothetical protein
MSKKSIFNDIDSVFNTSTESEMKLPKFLTYKKYNNTNSNNTNTNSKSNQQGGSNIFSATSSEFNQQGGGNNVFSETSDFNQRGGGGGGNSNTFSETSDFSQQGGGHGGNTFSVTSSDIFQKGGKKREDELEDNINHLISMITSEKMDDNYIVDKSETSTSNLESQLHNILTGGAKKKKTKSKSKSNHKSNKTYKTHNASDIHEDYDNKVFEKSLKHQKGGGAQVEDIRNFFVNLKSQGVNVDIKLDNKTFSDYFNMGDTTTELVGGNNMLGNIGISSETSSENNIINNQMGGAKRPPNPGFLGYGELKKLIAETYKIPNGAGLVQKITSAVKTDAEKELGETKSKEEFYKKAKDFFIKNKERYKKMLGKN